MCCREYCSNMMQYVWYLWGSGRGQKGGEIDETEMELFPRIPIPLNPPYFIWEIYRFSSKNFTFHKTWQTKYKGPFWIHWAFFGVLLGRTSFAFVISSILLVFRRNVFSFNFDHFNHHRHLLLIVIITFLVRLSSDFSLEVLDLEHGDAGHYICEVDCHHHLIIIIISSSHHLIISSSSHHHLIILIIIISIIIIIALIIIIISSSHHHLITLILIISSSSSSSSSSLL